MNTPSARDVEEPSEGLDAEDIKFLRSLRTSATPGPSSDGEASERLGGPGICHRGDRDCSLRCPEREPATPTCPAHQEAIWVREGRRPGHCPRLPRSQLLDVGVDHGGMMGDMP